MIDPGYINGTAANGQTPAEVAFRGFWRIAGLLKRLMEPRFARFGISPAQWGVLRLLHRGEHSGNPPPRLTDLSSQLILRPPSVSGLVDRLERMRLVSKASSSSDDDQRFRRVQLTDDGRHLVQRVLTGHGEWISHLMAGLTQPEQIEFSRMLENLGSHLEDLPDRSEWTWGSDESAVPAAIENEDETQPGVSADEPAG